MYPHHTPIGGDHAVFKILGLAVIQTRPAVLQRRFSVFWVQVIRPERRAAGPVCHRITKDALRLKTHKAHPECPRVRLPHDAINVVDQIGELILRLAQRRFSLLALRDVTHHGDDVVTIQPHPLHVHLHRESRSILTPVCGFKHQRARVPEFFFPGFEALLVLRGIHIHHAQRKHLFACVTKVCASLLIDVHKPPRLRIYHLDGIVHAIHQCAEHLQRVSSALALRDVTTQYVIENQPAGFKRAKPHLHREMRSVFPLMLPDDRPDLSGTHLA